MGESRRRKRSDDTPPTPSCPLDENGVPGPPPEENPSSKNVKETPNLNPSISLLQERRFVNNLNLMGSGGIRFSRTHGTERGSTDWDRLRDLERSRGEERQGKVETFLGWSTFS